MKTAVSLTIFRTFISLLLALSFSGCMTYARDAAYVRGKSNEALRTVESIQAGEADSPNSALKKYQRFLETAKIDQEYSYYQQRLASSLPVIQANPHAELPDDAALGFPDIFWRWLQATVKAHQGLARIYLSQKNFAEAEAEAVTAIKLIKLCQFCPDTVTRSLLESNRILQEIDTARGEMGKAIVRKLDADLLEDHLNSDGGADEFYAEKAVLFSGRNRKQFEDVQKFFDGVNKTRRQEKLQTLDTMQSALVMANATFQPMMTQSLVKSGAMTPQMAQFQNTLTQIQTQVMTSSLQGQTLQGMALNVGASPLGIPGFFAQLVDPRMGANTPDIIKQFAREAIRVGGAVFGLEAEANQVTQAVDDILRYREMIKAGGSTEQISQFGELFSRFASRVEGIRGPISQ